MSRDRRVVAIRRRFVALAAAIEAAPDEETASRLLVDGYHELEDSLRNLRMSRPDVTVTPGELHDPREALIGVPDSDLPTYDWAVVYFYGPKTNRRKIVESVIHGVPSRQTFRSPTWVTVVASHRPDQHLYYDLGRSNRRQHGQTARRNDENSPKWRFHDQAQRADLRKRPQPGT